jgi:hypothetical protein
MLEALYTAGKPTPARLKGGWILPISFTGEGRARFRLQHTRDRNGEPDDLAWADVTLVSDATRTPKAAINGGDSTVSGVLVDWVEGEQKVFYRRYRAEWIRVVPHDEEDEEALKQCAAFSVTMEFDNA